MYDAVTFLYVIGLSLGSFALSLWVFHGRAKWRLSRSILIGLVIFCGVFVATLSSSDNIKAWISGKPEKVSNIIKPIYDPQFTPEEAFMAKKAFDIFCLTCIPLMDKYASDIESLEISRDSSITEQREYGWEKQFLITVKIKDRPSVIPFETHTWGHYEYFSMGGPLNPGFTSGKHPVLCGIIDGEPHSLVPVASLSFIKK